MLELDFAFLNMMDRNRQGLAARKFFLDRLAPIFYSPRVEQLINFGELGVKGCNVFLPLGEANWQQLEAGLRSRMLEKSEGILQEYALQEMAADRRLKKTLINSSAMFPLIFGDNFIKALAAVLVRQALECQAIEKLVLVGDMNELLPLLENLGRYLLPISVQNTHPARYEYTAYHLLYEKGLAISNSYLSPESWVEGDLILLFDAGYRRLALAAPRAFYIELADDSQGLAPSLERALHQAGLDPGLQTLAPILEACLYAKAGIPAPYAEKEKLEDQPGAREDFETLITTGEDMGIWEPFLNDRVGGFLDKGIGALYNTIKD